MSSPYRALEANKSPIPPSLTSRFRDFFTELYTSTVPDAIEPMNLFLESVSFPQLTEDQVNLLEAPLKTEEIASAVARFSRSKSPGLDGLPIEFYSHFKEILTPKLLALYNDLL